MKSTEPSTAASATQCQHQGLSGRGAIAAGEVRECGLRRPSQPACRRWPCSDCLSRAHPPNQPSPTLQDPQCTAAVATGGGSWGRGPERWVLPPTSLGAVWSERLCMGGTDVVTLASPEHLRLRGLAQDVLGYPLKQSPLGKTGPSRTFVCGCSLHSTPGSMLPGHPLMISKRNCYGMAGCGVAEG